MIKPMHNGYKWVAPIKLLTNLMLASLVGCGSLSMHATENWQSGLYLDHELVGKIWSSADNQFVDETVIFERAANAKYLLLGEKHDNPDHHTLQLLFVENLVQRGVVASLAFEMLGLDSQVRLDSMQTERLHTLEQIKAHLQWDEAGWDWSYYGPLVQAGYSANVPLLAANIDNAAMMEVYGGALPAEASNVLDALVMDKLHQDIDESHCGMLPASQFPAMVRVQQSRDSQMASVLLAAEENSDGQGVNVLIAGNYHVRKDLGVPNYISKRQSDLSPDAIVTISFSEVDPESTNPADYLQQFASTQAYDYIWFTPAVSNEDYCASMQRVQ